MDHKTGFKMTLGQNEGKPAAQVSNKIDLRHGWNFVLKSTMYSDYTIYML